MKNLNELYRRYANQLSSKEKWHIENAAFLPEVPAYVWAYFDRFKESEVEGEKEQEIKRDTINYLPLEEKKKRLLKERAHAHSRILSCKNNDERYQLAHEIVSIIQPQLNALYKQLDEIRETGEIKTQLVPENERAIIEKVKTLLRRRNTIEKLIIDNNKKYASSGNKEYLKKNEQLREELGVIKAYLYIEGS
jgi:hypothetical protein